MLKTSLRAQRILQKIITSIKLPEKHLTQHYLVFKIMLNLENSALC